MATKTPKAPDLSTPKPTPASGSQKKAGPTPRRDGRAPSAQAARVTAPRAATKTPASKPIPKRRRATFRDWVGAARIPTLPLSVAPVILGAASGYFVTHEPGTDWWHWWRVANCLFVAVCLQLAVNYANDYSDGIRGTDAGRAKSAPGRLVASGKAKPRTVLTVAIVCFALAAAGGLVLTIRTGHWWFIAVGVACILAAWFYTGGKRPYGYLALGEVFVFVFFGLVATLGTDYAITSTWPQLDAWFAAIAAGAFATATILIAATRDIPSDRIAGKRTLAVRIGPLAAKIVYVVLLAVPYAVLVADQTLWFDNAIYAWFTLLLTIPAAIIALTAKTPRELVTVLRLTALASLAYALLLGWAIAF